MQRVSHTCTCILFLPHHIFFNLNSLSRKVHIKYLKSQLLLIYCRSCAHWACISAKLQWAEAERRLNRFFRQACALLSHSLRHSSLVCPSCFTHSCCLAALGSMWDCDPWFMDFMLGLSGDFFPVACVISANQNLVE